MMSPTLRSIPALEQRLLLSGAAPYAGSGQVGTVVHGQPLSSSVSILCWDPESDPLTYSSGGVSMNSDGSFVYTSAAGVLGDVTIPFSVFDGTSSSSGSLTITVTNAVPDYPQNDGLYSTLHDRVLLESVAGNDSVSSNYIGGWQDSDGDSVTFLQVTNTIHGNAVLNPSTGMFTYQPNSGYVGEDSFTYKLTDGIATSSGTATVTINVTNHYPGAQSDSYYEIYNPVVQGNVSNNDYLVSDGNGGWVDADGDSVAFIVETTPALGSFSLNPSTGAFTYQKPTGYYAGHETMYFTYSLSDGVPFSSMMTPSVASVTMVISFPFDAVDDNLYANTDPVTMSQYPEINYFVFEGDTLQITAAQGVLKNDTSPDYIPYLKAVQQGNGQYGTFNIADSGAFTYTPYSWVFESPLFTDMGLEDTCQYVAKDPAGKLSEPGTVTVDLVELYITKNGTDVDQNPNLLNNWIGEKVALSVASRGEFPAILGLSVFQWTISGKAVSGYTGYSMWDSEADPDGDGVAKKSVDASILSNQSLGFYWYEAGNHTVSVTVSVPVLGQSQVDSATFNSQAPCVEVRTSQTNSEKSDLPGKIEVQMKHTNPDGSVTHGITFTRSADYVAQSHGNFRWTQIVYNSNFWTDAQGVKHLDQYHGLDNFVQLTTDEFCVTDSPQTKFDTDYREITRRFKGEMYLMYKSSEDDSIWVAINVVNWTYEWSMKKDANGNWDWIENDPPVVDIEYEYSLPEWDNIVVNDPI